MASLQPHVVDFMQMTALGEEGLIIEELSVPGGSFLVGKTLAESELKPKYGVTVIGIRSAGERMAMNPGPDTRLKADDIVVMIGPVSGLEKLSQDLGGVR